MIWECGKPETGCGVGSTMAATANIRAWLPGALERLAVKTLLDAPCGDRNWIRHISLPCSYIGVDHESALVKRARDDGTDVRQLDLRKDELPACDAILSRDFFQHLSVADAQYAMNSMRKTGAKWLITTCHGRESGDISTGARSFRFVNMRKAFGEPVDSALDGKDGRILGIWAL